MKHSKIFELAELYAYDIIDALESGADMQGLCIRCGADAYNVEPDAEQYRCEYCGERAVFGLEQLVLYIAP